jgi:histidine ammonia-lyase
MNQANIWVDQPINDHHSLLQFLQADKISLSDASKHRIQHCRDYLNRKMTESDELYYGINTGFGYLQNVRVDNTQLEQLQSNLIQSHACGMGDEVPQEIVRYMLALKARSLSYGHSGVQIKTVQRLLDMFNHHIYPVVFTQGSLGASGDLAPLSHLCLPLLGLGQVYYEGKKWNTADLWKKFGWENIQLQSKEGLALINGTQFMISYGVFSLLKGNRLYDWANAIAAMSFEGFDAVRHPYQPQIHAVRPHNGQVQTAKAMLSWLEGSEIAAQKKSQVQDPYSFRCIPQVHGASKDAIDYVFSVFLKEINAVTDNPNVFPDEDLIVSGGNFHGQPLAITLDFLSIALSELASISERRTYQLISGLRGLPAFLVKDAGLNSGFMIPQYTAAGIVSENKQLSTPSSVDSIPSSINQEDHVSMGANGAVKCKRIADNLEKVLAIELMTAAQAMEFRRPLQSSEPLETLFVSYREQVRFNDADRILHDDMIASVDFIRQHELKQPN